MSKKVLVLGLATLIFFGIFSYLIIEFVREESFSEVIFRGINIPLQLIIGAAYGCLVSFLAILITFSRFFETELDFYTRKVSPFNLDRLQIVFLSLCAGIGEELFFRAAVQPVLGVWVTSVIFVAIHGYLNPYNWRISIYGIFMVISMSGLGFLFDKTGFFTAMAAHTVIDIVLLYKLSKRTYS